MILKEKEPEGIQTGKKSVQHSLLANSIILHIESAEDATPKSVRTNLVKSQDTNLHTKINNSIILLKHFIYFSCVGAQI